MRLFAKALSKDPSDENTLAPWTVGPSGRRGSRPAEKRGRLDGLRRGGRAVGGLAKAIGELRRGVVDDLPLTAPFDVPDSPLGGRIRGQRRFATQQYDLELIKSLAKAADCSLNDIVLYLCGTALRSYLSEFSTLPDRSLTAVIPVNLREEDDGRIGTAIASLVADLGTNIDDPRERLESIKRSTEAAKRHLNKLPDETQAIQVVAVNGPYIAGVLAGLRDDPIQPRHLQRPRPDRTAVPRRRPDGRDVPDLVADARKRAQHHVHQLCGHPELRHHRRPGQPAAPAAPGLGVGRRGRGDRADLAVETRACIRHRLTARRRAGSAR